MILLFVKNLGIRVLQYEECEFLNCFTSRSLMVEGNLMIILK